MPVSKASQQTYHSNSAPRRWDFYDLQDSNDRVKEELESLSSCFDDLKEEMSGLKDEIEKLKDAVGGLTKLIKEWRNANSK